MSRRLIPSTSRVSESSDKALLCWFKCLLFNNFAGDRVAGGVIVEQDENARLVAKPYNVAEANKQKELEKQNEQVTSLVTASIMAQ